MQRGIQVMKRKELKERVKGLGYSMVEFSQHHGISIGNVYHWDDVPKWAEYWVRMVELERELIRIKTVLRELI